MDWKRIAAIVGFVLLVIALAYGLFALFFRSGSTPVVNAPANQPGVGGLPSVGSGTPGQLNNTPGGLLPSNQPGQASNAPSAVADGGLTETSVLVPNQAIGAASDGTGVVYYQPNDGKFYRVTSSGTATPLSSEIFHDVQNVTWAPNRSEAVLQYPDNSNIIYNFDTQKQTTLPSHWQDFSFSPTGDQLAFKSLGLDANSRWLGVAGADGASPTAVQALGNNADNVHVDWSPSRQVVATYADHTGANQEEIYFVGLNGENFKSMTAPGIGFQSSWTPDGHRLLYSVASGDSSYKPELWIADASGDNIGNNRENLELNTWANKCTFSSTTNLICAVPNNLPEGAGLTPAIASTASDTFYRVDLTSGRSTVLAEPSTNVSAQNLTTSSDGHWLFFQDAGSGQLYKIAL